MQMREEEGKYESWVEGQRHVSLFSSELQREKHNNRKMLPGVTQRKSDSKKKLTKNKVIVCHPGMTKREAFPTQTRCQGALTADERSQTGKSGRCRNKGIWLKGQERDTKRIHPPTHPSIHPSSLPLTRLQNQQLLHA